MKNALTSLSLALLALGAQAQQDAADAPAAPPAPPAPPAVPAMPAPLTLDLTRIAVDSAFAGQVLSHEKLVKGAPYCADAVHETVQPLADGNRIVHKQSSHLCRDGEGRSRQEVERNGRKIVYLRDPVAGEAWLLDPDKKTARYLGGMVSDQVRREHAERQREYSEKMRDYTEKMREYGQKMREWSRQHTERVREALKGSEAASAEAARAALRVERTEREGREVRQVFISTPSEQSEVRIVTLPTPPGAPLAPLPPIPGAVNLRVEKVIGLESAKGEALPAREIDGVKATGQRYTRTIEAGKVGNEKPILITREVWTSPDLQLTLSSQDKDPRSGEQNYQLQNLRRAEPDAALMRVPADYKKSGEPKPRESKKG